MAFEGSQITRSVTPGLGLSRPGVRLPAAAGHGGGRLRGVDGGGVPGRCRDDHRRGHRPAGSRPSATWPPGWRRGRESCLAAGHRRECPRPLTCGRRPTTARPSTTPRPTPWPWPSAAAAAGPASRPPPPCSTLPWSPWRFAFEDGFLPGYLVAPRAGTAPGGRPRGTLVAFGGFDSGAEEMYFQLGAAGRRPGLAGRPLRRPGPDRLHAGEPDHDLPPRLRGAGGRRPRRRREPARPRAADSWPWPA